MPGQIPLCAAVACHWPPSWSAASKTVVPNPASSACLAVTSPLGPAPMIATRAPRASVTRRRYRAGESLRTGVTSGGRLAPMVLLSGMMRSAAIYGDTDTVAGRLAGRQGGQWAQRTVRAAFPTRQHPHQPPVRQQPQRSPDAQLRDLAELRDRGLVTDAE